jgi:hypothetical protein
MTISEIDKTLKRALALAARGFWILPVRYGDKRPAVKDWPNVATRDPDQITEWFESERRNIGIYAGKFKDRKMVVIDVDNKNGKDGNASLDNLQLIDDLPNTMINHTPTGGRHLFFQTDETYRNSVEALGEGLDIRAYAGYVVGPGSFVNGEYTAKLEPVAELPNWFAEKINRARPKATVTDTGEARLDTPDAIERATTYLKDAELATEGEGGDATTFAVACCVMDFGVSVQRCFDLMKMHWNDRCTPPWDEDDLTDKVNNARKYRQTAVGSMSGEAQFGGALALPDYMVKQMMRGDPSAQRDGSGPKQRLFFEMFDDIRPDVSKPNLIEDMLGIGEMSVLYGESNSGKTFLAIHIAMAIATGRGWNGKQVEQGPVLFIAAEGGGSLRRRVEAYRKVNGCKGAPFGLVPCPVNLLSDDDLSELKKLIEEFTSEYGKPSLIVIDTLSRSMPGGNENSPEDMTKFIRNVDELRLLTDAHLMIVHHTGKDVTKGARGHSSLRAATDTEQEVTANGTGQNATFTCKTRKQRDFEPGRPITFGLKVVELGQDHYGKIVTSCVVTERCRDFNPVAGFSPSEWTAYDIIVNAAEEFGINPPPWFKGVPNGNRVVKIRFCREAYVEARKTEKKSFPDAPKTESIKRDFWNQCGKLVEKGYIGKNKEYLWLTEEAESADNAEYMQDHRRNGTDGPL